MNEAKTTRRSFFGWLGALLAVPFVGWRKTNLECQHIATRVPEGKALWYGGWRRFDLNMNNPLAKGLVAGPEVRGYRFATADYVCVWSRLLSTEAIEQLEKGADPWDIFPHLIIEYRRLSKN